MERLKSNPGSFVAHPQSAEVAEARKGSFDDVAERAQTAAVGRVGAWGEDEATTKVLEASKAAGEDVWRMPLLDLHRDALRSEVADMKNSGERWGGAINAAMFLKEFVRDAPWVHLDIAGPSQSPKERGYHNKGATGVGVRTLVELVRRRAENIAAEPEPPAQKSAPKEKLAAKQKPAPKQSQRAPRAKPTR